MALSSFLSRRAIASLATLCHLILLFLNSALRQIAHAIHILKLRFVRQHPGLAHGKTVLVTTGRQAKTLHTVRALKEIGARVIVTDYEQCSASAFSLACDKFIVLPQMSPSRIDEWVQHFHRLLIDNNVDVVLPVSTINEVLYIALAKQKLSPLLPHVQWLCPDLQTSIQLDDRVQFAALCEKYGVPCPEGGVLNTTRGISNLVDKHVNGVILKRVESSVNRSEEIVPLKPGDPVPSYLRPSNKDPWQWQRFVKGLEYSVWYVCVNGRVTFSACYHSAPDLVQFDPAPLADEIDIPLRRLIQVLGLNGQFAFDFLKDEKTGKSYVIECNPRASSILETVSGTPRWAEAFFGIDVSSRTVHNRIGFLYHKNCWPFAPRSEGFFSIWDPLPMLCAEVAWPLNAIATKGMGEHSYQMIDVNICKIIVRGPSPSRALDKFRAELENHYLDMALLSLKHVNTLLLDASIAGAMEFATRCRSLGLKVVPFSHPETETDIAVCIDKLVALPEGKISNDFVQQHRSGETRMLLNSKLAQLHGSVNLISYRFVEEGRTWSESNEIPLRRLRAIHLMGSCTSEYYRDLSSYYGYECMKSIGHDGRFEHIVAYVHLSGLWSIGSGRKSVEYFEGKAERLSTAAALGKLEQMNVDVMVPHMFDYVGLTGFRGLFDVLRIPMMGCTAEALALSTNKVRTKGCAAMAGVLTPKHEVLRKGEMTTLAPPFIVKPTEEDNSQGISIVRKEEEIENAIAGGFEFGDVVMCEEFIELGRELRVGIIEKGEGEYEMLPVIEYLLSEEMPMRTPSDKYVTNEEGKVIAHAAGGRVCPAVVEENLRQKLLTAAVRAHVALGCRDYSIFDFRVDRKGDAYLLESCLYCSFAPKSVLVSMQKTMGIGETELFERIFERAMTRRLAGDGGVQKVGMKRRG